ncbi:MAG: DUF4912 domain-containing protein [Deltaproteobacteria bacterium]|nr:DUF4912 domain-containing protein [Deltaproteobacteria bacterium]
MSGFHERFLGRLPLSVLRSVAKRMDVEGAEGMEREALVAALSEAPGRRAAAFGQSLRRLVNRLPGGVLKGVGAGVTPRPSAGPGPRGGTGAAGSDGEAAAGPAGPAPDVVRAEQRGAGGATLGYETVTMVDVLLRQGHVDKARTTLQRILEREPGNAEARRRLDELVGRAGRAEGPPAREVPAPASAAAMGDKAHPARVDEPVFRPHADGPPEPIGLLDFEEPPLGYGRVYAGLLPVEPTLVYAYWEVTPDAVETVRRKLGDAEARLVLRFVSHHPEAPAGGAVRDVEATDLVGEYFFLEVVPGSSNRLAVGLQSLGGLFEPICHTGMATTAAGVPSADTREVWLDVEPPVERPAPLPQPIRILERTEGTPQEALVSRAHRIGLGGLPEDTQQRLLTRLHEVLRSLARPGALPTSPGMTPRG